MIKNKEKIEILYEDDAILVCVKPAGIPTQSRRIGMPDMETLLKNHITRNNAKTNARQMVPPRSRQQKRPPFLAVIHRLDQPVEGLLVFAKTPSAARSLNAQLTAHGFGKHYRALLEGIPAADEGTLEHYLCRDARANTSFVCTPDTLGAKKARLFYRVVHKDGLRCIADITLDTGRHHQIRVQMSAIGCPIVGDRKYGWHAPAEETISRSRIELYSCRLDFKHPVTNIPMHFEYPALPF